MNTSGVHGPQSLYLLVVLRHTIQPHQQLCHRIASQSSISKYHTVAISEFTLSASLFTCFAPNRPYSYPHKTFFFFFAKLRHMVPFNHQVSDEPSYHRTLTCRQHGNKMILASMDGANRTVSKKSVSFDHIVATNLTIAVDEMTPEEKIATWFTRSEYLEIRVLEKTFMMSLKIDGDDDNDETYLHSIGLETRTGRKRRRRRMDDAYNFVFVEQELQWKQQLHDVDRMSRVYSFATKDSTIIAHERAVCLERDVLRTHYRPRHYQRRESGLKTLFAKLGSVRKVVPSSSPTSSPKMKHTKRSGDVDTPLAARKRLGRRSFILRSEQQ